MVMDRISLFTVSNNACEYLQIFLHGKCKTIHAYNVVTI